MGFVLPDARRPPGRDLRGGLGQRGGSAGPRPGLFARTSSQPAARPSPWPPTALKRERDRLAPSAGGGPHSYEPEPALPGRGAEHGGDRTIPDVSFDADRNTGVAVYDSYDKNTGGGPWDDMGGTSLAAPPRPP